MDWIPSLLKHLSISRAAVVAVFITALALYGGPKFAPDYFEVVPAPWSILVQAALIFSGCLVVFWAWTFFTERVSKLLHHIVQMYKAKNLDENEMALLCGMGLNPSEPLNINRIDFTHGELPWSELELLNILRQLRGKGLVSRNRFASNLFSLTSRGQEIALKITLSSEEFESDQG